MGKEGIKSFSHSSFRHVHPSGYKVLCRVIPIEDQKAGADLDESYQLEGQFRLEVLVDEQWTSREIVVICSLVNEFRHFVRRISLDAPIFELVCYLSQNK